MSDRIGTRWPLVQNRADVSGVTRRIKEIKAALTGRPILELVEVTAVSSPTITIKKIGTSVDIPSVRCVGWGAITLPSVGQYVWVLWLEGGSLPIAIGVQ